MAQNPQPTPENSDAIHWLVPTWFKVVSVIALLWNLLGLMAFVMQITMSQEAIAALPENQQPLYENVPLWVNAAFACAVIFGTLGCVGLVMRRKWALPLLVVSLVGVLVQNFHIFAMSDAVTILGPTIAIMPAAVILIGVGLLIFARSGIAKGWLR